MKLVIGLILATLCGVVVAKDVYVDGHYRKDGTYVQPHYRSSPNNNTYDNYSTKGNSNPYTGEKGYADPYKSDSNAFKYDSGYGSSKKRY